MQTRSQQSLKTAYETAGPRSSSQNQSIPIAAGQSRPMPQAISTKAGTKRQAAKQDLELAKRPKRNPQVKILRDVAKALLEVEELQDTRDDLQTKLTDADLKVKKEQQKNETLRDRITQLEAVIEASERKIERLGREKGKLNVDLLKQQPRSQITDARLVEMYQELRGNISSWVDNELSALEAAWRTIHQDASPNASFFHHGASPEHSAFLACGYRFGEVYHVESVIHTQLQELLFKGDTSFFALSDAEGRFLHSVESGFGLQDPPKDFSSVRHLRSEVLKAFTMSAPFHDRRTKAKSIIEDVILMRSGVFFPGLYRDQTRIECFRQTVIEPALDLAVAVRTSTAMYEFNGSMVQHSRFDRTPLRRCALVSYTMIDIETRETIRAGRMLAKSNNITAEQVLLLAPSLQRCDPGKPVKCLTPDAICVKVGHAKESSGGVFQAQSEYTKPSPSASLEASKVEFSSDSLGGVVNISEEEQHREASGRDEARSALSIEKTKVENHIGLGAERNMVVDVIHAAGLGHMEASELPRLDEKASEEHSGPIVSVEQERSAHQDSLCPGGPNLILPGFQAESCTTKTQRE